MVKYKLGNVDHSGGRAFTSQHRNKSKYMYMAESVKLERALELGVGIPLFRFLCGWAAIAHCSLCRFRGVASENRPNNLLKRGVAGIARQ